MRRKAAAVPLTSPCIPNPDRPPHPPTLSSGRIGQMGRVGWWGRGERGERLPPTASCAPLPPSLQQQGWRGHPRLRPCATRYPVDPLQGAADAPGGIHGCPQPQSADTDRCTAVVVLCGPSSVFLHLLLLYFFFFSAPGWEETTTLATSVFTFVPSAPRPVRPRAVCRVVTRLCSWRAQQRWGYMYAHATASLPPLSRGSHVNVLHLPHGDRLTSPPPRPIVTGLI